MYRYLTFILLLYSFLSAQSENVSAPKFPEEGIEFKLNTLTGLVTDSITGQPIEDVYINIYTGNKVLKHTLITDENGYFSKNNIGYLWKPKIQMNADQYKEKSFSLDPAFLDSSNNIRLNSEIIPIPENERIQNLEKSTLTKRAETFFIKGNVFYNYISSKYAERVIISSKKAIEVRPKHIAMKINNKMYDISRCYVPQDGKYENLSYILHSLLEEPIFKNSKHPMYLPETLLKPSVIFGKVLNSVTDEPITGVEIILTVSTLDFLDKTNGNDQIITMANYNNMQNKSKPIIKKHKFSTYKRRVSDQNGEFAFTINDPATYELEVRTPKNLKQNRIGRSYIVVQYGKGGWYKSNFYLKP